MRLVIGIFALLLSFPVMAQQCTTTVLASFYDQLTKDEIETLKPGDLEIRIDGKKVPVESASRDFNNRLLILLETEGSAKNDKLAELVTTVTQQARTTRKASQWPSACLPKKPPLPKDSFPNRKCAPQPSMK